MWSAGWNITPEFIGEKEMPRNFFQRYGLRVFMQTYSLGTAICVIMDVNTIEAELEEQEGR